MMNLLLFIVVNSHFQRFIIKKITNYIPITQSFDDVFVASGGNLVKRSLKDTIKCLEDSKFYRNPERPTHKVWTNNECSKYYLCLDGEVFEFKCSVGLLFDVMRQICDFKQNVDNCDVTAGLHRVFCCNINLSIKWFVMFFIKFLVSIFLQRLKYRNHF